MKTKKELKFFSIFNYDKEQEYLQKQHKKGWKFVKVKGIGMYHFEECKAEDVVYQLDYNQDSSRDKEEYIKMFTDCGWEYIQDYMDYSYFRKNISDAEIGDSIFCDESSRFEMLERVYKGKMTPMLLIICGCVLPQLFMNLSSGRYSIAFLMGIVLLIDIMVFAKYSIQYSKKKRNA